MAHDIDIGKTSGPVGAPPEQEKPPQFGLTTAAKAPDGT